MGFPGYGWTVKVDDPAWPWLMWIIRLDVYETYGGYRRTTQDLLSLLRKTKQDAIPDLEGNPTIPLGIDSWPTILPLFPTRMRGVGYEVDSQMRLMSMWASVEFHESLKYWNLLWREGLCASGLLTMKDTKLMEDIEYGRNAVAFGRSSLVAILRNKIDRYLYNERGPDDPELTAALAKQYIMLVNPVRDNPGNIRNRQPGPR